jgi:hypothetical protein
MNAKQKIQAKVAEVYGDNSPNIFNGLAYDGQKQNNGWHYQPFNAQVIYLGKSVAEAIEYLDSVVDSRE